MNQIGFGQNLLGITSKNPIFFNQKIEKTSVFHRQRFSKEIKKIPQAYCYNELAFFCKLEVKIEKKINFPFKFRLGTVDHTDYLEGKFKNKNNE